MGMRSLPEKGVKFDPSIKIKVQGIQNRVIYVTDLGHYVNYDEGTVEVLENPYIEPKEKKAKAEADAKAKEEEAAKAKEAEESKPAKAKATRAANKKAKED